MHSIILIVVAAVGMVLCGCHARPSEPIEVAPVTVNVTQRVSATDASTTEPSTVANDLAEPMRSAFSTGTSLYSIARDFRRSHDRWPDDIEELRRFAVQVGRDAEVSSVRSAQFDEDAERSAVTIHFTWRPPSASHEQGGVFTFSLQ